MENAARVNDFKKEADFSYSMEKFVGDAYLCVGGAARFADPIFCSGVSVALASTKYASEQIVKAMEKGDFSEAAFKPYETKLRSGVSVWYEFIRFYYKLLPSFTRFIQSKKHRLEMLQLLQGEVFDRQDVPLLGATRKFIKDVEQNDKHILRNALMDLELPDVAAA